MKKTSTTGAEKVKKLRTGIIQLSPTSCIRVAVEKYKEKDRVDIRHMYKTDENDTEWKFTKKGVILPYHDTSFVKELNKILQPLC